MKDYLTGRGLDISNHRPTKLTSATLHQAALPVAMGIEHRDQVIQEFDRVLALFSEIAYDAVDPLYDVSEVVPDWRNNEEEAAAYGCSVMDYIVDGMPGFVSRMHDFIPADPPPN